MGTTMGTCQLQLLHRWTRTTTTVATTLGTHPLHMATSHTSRNGTQPILLPPGQRRYFSRLRNRRRHQRTRRQRSLPHGSDSYTTTGKSIPRHHGTEQPRRTTDTAHLHAVHRSRQPTITSCTSSVRRYRRRSYSSMTTTRDTMVPQATQRQCTTGITDRIAEQKQRLRRTTSSLTGLGQGH